MLTSLRSEGVQSMTKAKLAPNLPGWMVEHANRYLPSGGTDGHMHKPTQPGRPQITVPSLLLTTTGRKSGEKFIFPLFYGDTGDGGYIIVASKGGAPKHPARARSAPACGKRRWSSGRPTPTTRRRPSARSRWSCSIPFADNRILGC